MTAHAVQTTDHTDDPADLADILPFKQFALQCERQKLAGTNTLRWWFRYRDTNGLTSSGAVFDVHGRLFVNRRKFATWMSSGMASKARTAR